MSTCWCGEPAANAADDECDKHHWWRLVAFTSNRRGTRRRKES